MTEEERNELKLKYRRTFSGIDGDDVLRDLNNFCGLNDICFNPDSGKGTAFLLGMRRVALHIKEMMQEEELKQKQINTEETEE